jgi:hypothetical protein
MWGEYLKENLIEIEIDNDISWLLCPCDIGEIIDLSLRYK